MIVQCRVDSWPAPHLTFFTDPELRHSVVTSDRILLNAGTHEEDPAMFVLTMKIHEVRLEDAGTYYCHANNSLGEDSGSVTVKVTDTPPSVIDVTQCCRDANISEKCVDICSFGLDYDLLVARPECLPDFHAMMSCASDGSDHRHCCSTQGVPSACLDWCRGEPVTDSEVCAISHSDTIIQCFHHGKTNLPGLPASVKVSCGEMIRFSINNLK